MSDWIVKKISDITKTTSGGTPSRSNKNYYTGNILWVKSGELEDNFIDDTEEKITEEAIKKSSAKIFPKNTVLMAMYGATIGRTAVLKKAASTNQAVCAIFPNEEIFNHEFLRFQLIFKREDFLKQRYGGAQPNISQQIIKNFELSLPPFPEQHKIAAVLATVQKAIETQTKLIERTTELKKAMMHKLFTEGTRGEKQKMTEIGLVPESWEVEELGEIAKQIKINYQPVPNGNKKYIGLEHIDSGYSILNRYGNENEVKSSKYFFQKSQVLYGKLRPYLDKAVISQFDGVCSTDIIVLDGINISNWFLIYFMHSDAVINYAKKTTSGVQHPRTSWLISKS